MQSEKDINPFHKAWNVQANFPQQKQFYQQPYYPYCQNHEEAPVNNIHQNYDQENCSTSKAPLVSRLGICSLSKNGEVIDLYEFQQKYLHFPPGFFNPETVSRKQWQFNCLACKVSFKSEEPILSHCRSSGHLLLIERSSHLPGQSLSINLGPPNTNPEIDKMGEWADVAEASQAQHRLHQRLRQCLEGVGEPCIGLEHVVEWWSGEEGYGPPLYQCQLCDGKVCWVDDMVKHIVSEQHRREQLTRKYPVLTAMIRAMTGQEIVERAKEEESKCGGYRNRRYDVMQKVEDSVRYNKLTKEVDAPVMEPKKNEKERPQILSPFETHGNNVKKRMHSLHEGSDRGRNRNRGFYPQSSGRNPNSKFHSRSNMNGNRNRSDFHGHNLNPSQPPSLMSLPLNNFSPMHRKLANPIPSRHNYRPDEFDEERSSVRKPDPYDDDLPEACYSVQAYEDELNEEKERIKRDKENNVRQQFLGKTEFDPPDYSWYNESPEEPLIEDSYSRPNYFPQFMRGRYYGPEGDTRGVARKRPIINDDPYVGPTMFDKVLRTDQDRNVYRGTESKRKERNPEKMKEEEIRNERDRIAAKIRRERRKLEKYERRIKSIQRISRDPESDDNDSENNDPLPKAYAGKNYSSECGSDEGNVISDEETETRDILSEEAKDLEAPDSDGRVTPRLTPPPEHYDC